MDFRVYTISFERPVNPGLLTTSATHDTFSRQYMMRGLISIGLKLNTNARESFEHC